MKFKNKQIKEFKRRQRSSIKYNRSNFKSSKIVEKYYNSKYNHMKIKNGGDNNSINTYNPSNSDSKKKITSISSQMKKKRKI
jgi:hypothetical protein